VTMIEAGIYGAKRQSFRKLSARELLKRIIEASPKAASSSDLLRAFSIKAREDDDYIDSVIEYWFTNNYRSLLAAPRSTTATRKEARQRIDTIGEAVKAKIQQSAEIMLLGMVLPNGKPLAQLTGLECKEFAKVGPLLKKLGQRLKPSQIVGDVFDELQLRDLYRGVRA
jgi:hypothetical protein